MANMANICQQYFDDKNGFQTWQNNHPPIWEIQQLVMVHGDSVLEKSLIFGMHEFWWGHVAATETTMSHVENQPEVRM